MKLTLGKNWIAKVLSLLLAIAIWFLINEHLANKSRGIQRATIIEPPPKDWVSPDKRR